MTFTNGNNYIYDSVNDVYEGFPTDPKDFAVHVQETEDPWGKDKMVTVMTIVPIEFFEANGYMWDQYMDVEEKIPDSFGQCMECTYDTKLSVDQARAALLEVGFVEHEGYSNFMKEAHWEKY